jgi:hypothetical protein
MVVKVSNSFVYGMDKPICANCQYYHNQHGGVCVVNHKEKQAALAPVVQETDGCKKMEFK